MLGITETELESLLAESRSKLFECRESRVHPGRDEKILAGWNGLMIAAFAQAGAVLDEPRFTSAAVRAADFVLARMHDSSGRLLHTFKDGRAALAAYLDDYAAMIAALVEAHADPFPVFDALGGKQRNARALAPGHGVSPGQHGQRTQDFQTRGQRCEA